MKIIVCRPHHVQEVAAFSRWPRQTFTLSPSIVSKPKWDSIRRDGLKSWQGLQNSATIIVTREISSFHGKRRKWGVVWERIKFRRWRERGESRQLAIPAKKAFVSNFYFTFRNDTKIVRITSFDVTLLIQHKHRWLSRLSWMRIWLATCTKQIWEMSREHKNVKSLRKKELMNSSLSLLHPTFGNVTFVKKAIHLVIPELGLPYDI